MKRIVLWIMLLCVSPMVFSQNLQVLENTYQKVAVSFTTDTLLVKDISIPEGVFSMISVPDYGSSNNPGAPQLPLLTKMLQIPVCDSVVATVVNAQYTEYDASHFGITHPLYPSQPSVSKSTYPQFTYNQLVYNTNDFYALPLVSVEKAGIRRDMVLANIYVSPVQYNPVTQRIRVYSQIDVEFTFVNTNMAATNKLAKYASPMFELDNNMVVNRKSNTAKGPEFTHVPIKYLIIAHSMFSSNTDLESFIQWKRRLGYLVEVAYTSDSNVGTTTTSIKNFIQNKYNNATAADPAPTFLLLIGDVAQIPPFDSQCSNNNPANDHVTDLYYATLTGNDNLPDCYYGRLSATTQAHLTNQLAKIMMYEQYTMPDPSYLGKAVLIAGTDVSESTPRYSATHADGQINYIYNYYVNESSTSHNYTQVYKHNFYCSNDASTIRSEIGAGVGLANYTAHGYDNEWSNPEFTASQVSSMTNTGKYGLMIGNCCLSGKFNTTEYNECFGEALLRAANKGAMGYIGASNSSYWDEDVYWAVGVRSSINANMSYSSSALGAYDKMFHTHNEAHSEWVSTIGGMIQGGNLSVESSSSDIKKYYWEIYHCFGDPSVRVYLGIPSAMNVTADAIIPESNTSYTVQVAPYAYVALKKNSTEFIAAAFADASGSVTLTLPESLELGTYELVALAQNYIPYFQTVEVEAEGNCPVPGPLTVSNVTAFTANLSWTGGSAPYNIELKAGAGEWTITATNVNATNYSLTNLSENTDYSVRVQSVCSDENSSWRTQSFTTPVACPLPTNLACTAYTATTAALSWTENGSATEWILQYGTNSSFASGTYTQLTVNGTPSKTLAGLTAETTYYARVKANCGGIYGQSQWSEVCTFMPTSQTTECEDFESYTGTAYNSVGVLPTGWDVIFTGSSSNFSPHVATGIYNDGIINNGNGFCFTSGSSTYGTNNYAILPAYEGILQNISFKYRYESTSCGTLYFGYITDISNANTFVSLQTVPASTVQGTGFSYSLEEANIPSTARLAFKWSYNSSYYTCGIDDICITGVRMQITCPSPTSLSCTELTATSASLEWTENGTATEWVLQYGTSSAFDSGSYTEVSVSSTNTLLSGLTTDVTYYARVKANCGSVDGESLWSSSCSFKPSSEQTVEIGDGGTSTSSNLPCYTTRAYSYTQQIYTSEEIGTSGTITSVSFKNMGSETTRTCKIYMKNTIQSAFTSGSSWESVSSDNLVYNGSVTFVSNEWTTIELTTPFDYDGSSNLLVAVADNTGSTASLSCLVYTTTTKQAIYIGSRQSAINISSPSSGTTLSKKNQIRFTIGGVSNCMTPVNVAASNVRASSATISWEGDADSYNLYYRVSGNFVYDFEAAEAWSVDNFAPCTTYDGDGQATYGIQNVTLTNANYVGSVIAFQNGLTSNFTAHDGNAFGAFMAAQVSNSVTANNDFFILPEITVNQGTVFKFWARSVSDSYGLERMKVGVYNGDGGLGSYLLGSATSYVEVPLDWTEYSYDLSSYAGQTIQLAINCVSADAFALLIDDIYVGNPNLYFESTVTNVTSPYNLVGLTGITTYEVQVQAVCGEDGISDWTDEVSFTTGACESIVLGDENLTYTEDFENIIPAGTTTGLWTGYVPDCWTWNGLTDDPEEVVPQLYRSFAHSGSYSLRMQHQGIYAMPELVIESGHSINEVEMSFWMRNSHREYSVEIGVANDLDNLGNYVVIGEANSRTTNIVKYEFNFSEFTDLPNNGPYYIVFKNKSQWNDAYGVVYLDDITLSLNETEECTGMDVPYSESFEEYDVPRNNVVVEPRCWTLAHQDVENFKDRPQLYKGYAHSGENSLRMKDRCIYAMPQVDGGIDIREYKMSLYLRQPNTLYRLQVGVMTDLNDENTFVPVVSLKTSNTSTPEYKEFDFSDYSGEIPGEGYYIAFRNTLVPGANLDYSYNYIDDIQIEMSECVVTSLPYSESFETYVTTVTESSATEIEPDCWKLVSCVKESATTRPQLYRGFASDGTYSLRLRNLSVYALPRLANNVDLSNAKMEFDLRQAKSLYTLEVGVMSNLNDMSTYQKVKRFNNSTTNIQHVVVDFSTFNGDLSGRYIVFKNTLVTGANLDYSYNYIDAINLYEIGTTAAGMANGENVAADSEGYNNAPRGIEDNATLSNLNIYPNPTTGTLNLSGIAQRVEVYSQIGSLMAVYENVSQINISNLAEGIYFLRVTMPEGVAVRKVVKR